MTIRVASYNIRHGHDAGLDMAVIARDILAVQPDIVGLQEVDVHTTRVHGRDTLAELAKAADFAHYAFCRAIDFAGGEYGKLVRKMGKAADAVGFAVYLDMLEELSTPSREYDVDALVLYSDKTPVDDVMELKEKLISEGKSVTLQKAIPAKLRYKEIIKMDE